MIRGILIVIFLLLSSLSARAWLITKSGGTATSSCNAIITGSGANGNAILTGTATALAKLTCQ